MKSIYTTFNLKDPKSGAPIDLLKTMNIAFDAASQAQKAIFEKNYSDLWFRTNAPQMDLNAEGIVGKYKLRFLASIIGNDAATPLRPTDGFDVWKGEIPRMGHRFFVSASKLRKLKAVEENPRLSDTQKFNEIKKQILGEFKEAYLGTKDVADHIILRALSNGGVATFNSTINPDGRDYAIDYEMPEENKVQATLAYTNANIQTVDVVADIEKMKAVAENAGIDFASGELLMSPAVFAYIKRTKQIKLAVLGTDKGTGVVTDAKFAEYLMENNFPPVTIIRKKNRIQEDGVEKIVSPWNEDMIVFKPAGEIGELQPAFDDNAIIEEDNVEYTDAGQGIRMAKWRTGESQNQKAGEYTQGSWRVVPIINSIEAIINLRVNNLIVEGE